MLEREKIERGIHAIVDTENLVPAGHLLRKIDAALDFNKIYDMAEPLYCADNGRPSVDPVVLFRMVLIQHMYGLASLRQTAAEVRANIYCRWFLGYRLQEDTPHFSTIRYTFRHRFTSETADQIFNWMLMEMVEAGYPLPHILTGCHPAQKGTHRQCLSLCFRRYGNFIQDGIEYTLRKKDLCSARKANIHDLPA